ncbi:zinc ABC transporter, periplasmic zinc-binding protein [Candidatus Magnetoovum chiemensis]|nr:zinc ABC transporter, periplasmic zinc-binding protein [Candidatus Magnetoovum chiemensis]
MKRIIAINLSMVLMVSLSLMSCAVKDKDASSGKVNIVTTTSMIADIVKNECGDLANVTSLMGAGVDPHLYKASAGDVTTMSNADIIFYNGLHLEGKLVEVLENMGKKIKTVAVTDTISRDKLSAPKEFQGNYDPHVWFDVQLWIEAAKHTEDVLIKAIPDKADKIRANAEKYIADLRQLDDYVKAKASSLAPSQRVLITAHDAFNYFGRAYSFKVMGLQGISTASEAGTADVKALSDFIVENKIPAIFVESSVPHRNIEALQAAVLAKGFDVKIGGNLYSDALGSPDSAEGAYVGMVRYNIDTIVNALKGDTKK